MPDKHNQEDILAARQNAAAEIIYRDCAISSDTRNEKDADGNEYKVYSMSVSSDDPYKMSFWGMHIEETLLHKEENVRLGRMNDSGQILFNHRRDEYIGVCLGARVDGKKCHIDFRFGTSEKAKQVQADVDGGILRNVSIGYKIWNENHTTKKQKQKGKEVVWDCYDVDDWEMLEASIVTVPADPTVGIGRSLKELQSNQRRKAMPETITKDNQTELEQATASLEEVRAKLKAAEEKGEAATNELREKEVELSRITDIHNSSRLCSALGSARLGALISDAIGNGSTVREFQDAVADEMQKALSEDPKSRDTPTSLGLSEREAKNFNWGRFIRAINALDTPYKEDQKPRDQVACFELEAVEAARTKRDKELGDQKIRRVDGKAVKSYPVPWEVLNQQDSLIRATEIIQRNQRPGERVVTTAGATAGATIDTVHMASNWIDTLRDAAKIVPLVRTFPGLKGNIQFPRLTTNVTAGMIAEDAEGLTNDPVFDNFSMTPHTGSGGVIFSRRILQQSEPNVQAVLMANGIMTMAKLYDTQLIGGSGAGNNVLGVRNVTGINTKAYANNTSRIIPWADITDVSQKLLEDDALMGNLVWVMSPDFYDRCRISQKFTGTDGRALLNMEGNAMGGTLDGYRYIVKTDDIPVNNAIFGDWNQLYLGFWEALEIQLDYASRASRNGLVVRFWTDFDTGYPYPVSFCNVTRGT